MSNQIHELLASFDALPDPDKQIVAVEILRRSPESKFSLSTLDSLADELFAKLDEEEVKVR
ncbi:MAG TPA: hypothetical protein VG097_12305 [Gemmata sp.]|jgi:hypothetical protein|nr:hypothetical protein [Gemmata sp.]